jgi:antitoxin CptB
MSEAQESLGERRKRAIYRASHRGTKEMDLILGRFAAAHVEGMDNDELDVLEELLALPDPDLNRWTMLEAPGLENADLARLIARIRAFHGLDG